MKREIKFRGKRLDNGEWAYGYLFATKYGTYILVVDTTWADDPDYGTWSDPEDVMRAKKVDPETVGQYVYEKDAQDTEMYMGDILTCDSYPWQEKGEYCYHALVKQFDEHYGFGYESVCVNKRKRGLYEDVSSYFNIGGGYFHMADFRVIGNIHDNPGLLEAK